MKILVLNAGSSTQKSCLYDISDEAAFSGPSPAPLWEAQITGIGGPHPAALKVRSAHGPRIHEYLEATSSDFLAHMLQTIWDGPTKVLDGPGDIDIVGHRVVHGGHEYRQSALVTAGVKAAIARFSSLAPAHNPAGLQGIEVSECLLGQTPQLVLFDTAFHATLPVAAAIYPLPYELFEQGIRRYGFHGISHHYCAERAALLLDRDLHSLRLVTCHLGNGCSLAAIRDGLSVDTTMGFTPLEGLMMGTRSGSIDPGILTYLQREKGYHPADIDKMLNTASGLKGISGISGDMRDITAAMDRGEERARLALDIYVHRLRASIAAMLPSLGGLDALIFTAGVGENSTLVRASTCEAFSFIGLKIDEAKNEASPIDCDIATDDSTARVLVIHTEEDWAIARHCWKFINKN
jgi:acetate kinase